MSITYLLLNNADGAIAGYFTLTHKAIEIKNDKVNVYGHIHNKPVEPKFDDKNHICVSLDKTEFKPLLLVEIEGEKI